MNTSQLQNFISIAQTLNYSAVAKSAYISQPALTKQINRLENELGVTLFDRSRQGVSLTYAGEEFYKFAVDILDGIKQAENRMANIKAGQTGFLKVSSVYSMEDLSSEYIQKYNDLFPNITITVQIGNGAVQIMTIRKMSYDVFFSFSNLLNSFPDIVSVPVKHDRFAVYLKSENVPEYLNNPSGYLKRTKHFVEISSEGPFLTSITFKLMEILGLPTGNIVYYPSSTAMLIAVKAGIGFALLPLQMNFGSLPEGVTALPLDIPEAVIERSVGWNKSNKNIAVKNFIEMLER